MRTAVNGVQAVAAYREGLFRPGADGLSDARDGRLSGHPGAIRQIEVDAGPQSTQIVALTAHAMDGSRAECLAAGMNDQLSKPLTLAVLTGKLLEWLTQDRAQAAEDQSSP